MSLQDGLEGAASSAPKLSKWRVLSRVTEESDIPSSYAKHVLALSSSSRFLEERASARPGRAEARPSVYGHCKR